LFTDQRDLDLIREDVRFTLPAELATIAPAPRSWAWGDRKITLPGRNRTGWSRCNPAITDCRKGAYLAVKIVRQPNQACLMVHPQAPLDFSRNRESTCGPCAAGIVEKLQSIGYE
jgi:hypothetical protein